MNHYLNYILISPRLFSISYLSEKLESPYGAHIVSIEGYDVGAIESQDGAIGGYSGGNEAIWGQIKQ